MGFSHYPKLIAALFKIINNKVNLVVKISKLNKIHNYKIYKSMCQSQEMWRHKIMRSIQFEGCYL